jgi:hypothetical protein
MAPPASPPASDRVEPSRLRRALGTAGAILRERYRRLFPAAPSAFAPSWPINAKEAKGIIVRWPTAYEWPGAGQWMSDLLAGLGRLVRIEKGEVAQPYVGVVIVELQKGPRRWQVAIDYSDKLDQFHADCLSHCVLYFKMQYRRGGYGSDRVIPGGYINLSSDYYRYLPGLRDLRDQRRPLFDVYGRFGLEFAGDLRRRAVEMLQRQDRFRFEGSLSRVRYLRSLEEAARAQVCIDLPGKGDFCFRLIDYLGIGACVIGPRHRTKLHVPLVDRTHLVYTRDDLSDLVELCEHYLTHPDERAALVRASREFYERYLHRNQLAAYYLARILERLDGA